jgi:hypothetical protein
MRQLDKNDLAQMNRDYFQSLEKERLVEVATNLHKLAVEQWEKLQQNSQNSSRPPSSDNPYQKADLKEKEKTQDSESSVNYIITMKPPAPAVISLKPSQDKVMFFLSKVAAET